MRLEKFLAECGVASRHKATDVIKEGHIEINGRIVVSPNVEVNPSQDTVRYKGVRCKISPKVYIAFNKPRNFISTSSDNLGRRTVYKLLPNISKVQLFPIGRLDKDAEGLMLFTNDGDLANRIMHPRYGVEKVYYVVCDGYLDDTRIQALRKGIWLSEGKVIPKDVVLLKRMRGKSIMRLAICDGKKNEIKRIMKKIGSKVLYLKRLSIGPLKLADLKSGSYRFMDQRELKELISI